MKAVPEPRPRRRHLANSSKVTSAWQNRGICRHPLRQCCRLFQPVNLAFQEDGGARSASCPLRCNPEPVVAGNIEAAMGIIRTTRRCCSRSRRRPVVPGPPCLGPVRPGNHRRMSAAPAMRPRALGDSGLCSGRCLPSGDLEVAGKLLKLSQEEELVRAGPARNSPPTQ